MKKLSYIAVVLAAACLLPGCSDDNNRVSTPQAENANDLQAIELSVSNGNNFTAATRGAGMVGGLKTPEQVGVMDNNNVWKKQNLWVLMRHSGTTDIVSLEKDGNGDFTKNDLGYYWDNMGSEYELLNNQHLIAPDGTADGQITCNEAAATPFYYYPVTGNYDFYAYHIDDAANNQSDDPKTKPTIEGTGADYEYVVFTIDGTQDLMAAKADFYTDVVGSQATDEEKAELAGITENKVNGVSEPISYSAYAARRTVQPTLVFKHLLTKLNFYVVNMNEPAENAEVIEGVTDRDGAPAKLAGSELIEVTDISIVKTATKGNLVVTSKTAAQKAGDIKWTDWAEGDDALVVKEADLTGGIDPGENDGTEDDKVIGDGDLDALNPVALHNFNTDYAIGEGLLLQPIGAANYEGSITFKQTLKTDYNETDSKYNEETVSQTVSFTIKASDIKGAVEGVNGFAAGYAYNIYLKVYGVQEIKIEAVLTPWEDGGDVTITPEDDVFGPTDITGQKKTELDAIFAEPETEDDYIDLLDWAERYFVSAEKLAEIRSAYDLDGDDKVDAADWAAFRLQTKLNAEVKADTRAAIKETNYVEGYNALIEYLNNTTITSVDGAKTAEYTPSASCAYTLTCVESESGIITNAYFAEEPQSVNEALQLVQEAKEKRNEAYDQADALKELAERMEGNLTTCTEAGCDALLWYMTAQEDKEETTDVNEAKIAYPITAEDEIFTTYAIYKYQGAIPPAGVTAIKAILEDGGKWPEVSTEPEEPAFAISKGYFVEFTKDSYNQLPETYRSKYGEWESLTSAENSELPWLAVEFTPTPKNQLNVSVTTPDGKEIAHSNLNGITWDIEDEKYLLTLCARELGKDIVEGTWKVTINGSSVEIVVPATE